MTLHTYLAIVVTTLPAMGAKPPAHKPESPGESLALIIGIDGYEAMGKLTVCRNDAKALAFTLVEGAGYSAKKVILMTDDSGEEENRPTFSRMQRRIEQIAALAAKDDTVLIYFSGHGTTVEGQGYLVPMDGDEKRAIPLAWVKEKLEQSPAKNRLLILDACHAGSAAKGVGGIAPSLTAKSTVTMLLSCAPEQSSYPDKATGRSIFSSFLTDGLAGKADTNGDKKITQTELMEYVRKRMVEWCFKTSKTQTPVASQSIGKDVVLVRKPGASQHVLRTVKKDFEKCRRLLLFEHSRIRQERFKPMQATDFEVWKMAADTGNPEACCLVAVCCEEGLGVPKDQADAVKWYRLAAEAGNTDAMVNLGRFYDVGQGVSQSSAEALNWYRKAAEAGSSRGMHHLGNLYEFGNGVPQSSPEALNWYRKAVDAKNTDAMVSLGHMYEFGAGVSQSYTEAVKWYLKAAEAGNPDGMTTLGNRYEHGGKCVSQSYTEAVKWYRKAAEAGVPGGMYNLGNMYFSGHGVEKDRDQAVRLYKQAAEAGHKDARKRLKELGESQ